MGKPVSLGIDREEVVLLLIFTTTYITLSLWMIEVHLAYPIKKIKIDK
jgi:hypothetical protein